MQQLNIQKIRNKVNRIEVFLNKTIAFNSMSFVKLAKRSW